MKHKLKFYAWIRVKSTGLEEQIKQQLRGIVCNHFRYSGRQGSYFHFYKKTELGIMTMSAQTILRNEYLDTIL